MAREQDKHLSGYEGEQSSTGNSFEAIACFSWIFLPLISFFPLQEYFFLAILLHTVRPFQETGGGRAPGAPVTRSLGTREDAHAAHPWTGVWTTGYHGITRVSADTGNATHLIGKPIMDIHIWVLVVATIEVHRAWVQQLVHQ